jgi:hypothetical protein
MPNLYLSPRQVEKAIKQSAKKVLAAKGMNPSTKNGNKELKRVVKKLSLSEPCKNLEVATFLGEALGERIVTLSQKLGKNNLDKGVLLAIAIRGDLPSLDSLPTDLQATVGTDQEDSDEKYSDKVKVLEKTPEFSKENTTETPVLALEEAESSEKMIDVEEMSTGIGDVSIEIPEAAEVDPLEDENKDGTEQLVEDMVDETVNETTETFENIDQSNEVESILEADPLEA